MDKYGVDTTETADNCPLCGKKVLRSGTVLRCPTHGSAPFEELTRTHGMDTEGREHAPAGRQK